MFLTGRFRAPTISDDDVLGDARSMTEVADASVALVVTSPPSSRPDRTIATGSATAWSPSLKPAPIVSGRPVAGWLTSAAVVGFLWFGTRRQPEVEGLIAQ